MIFFNTDKINIEKAFDRHLEEDMEEDYLTRYEDSDEENG